MKFLKAFTLAEVLITLVIIGVISAITVPTMIAKYHEQQTVAKVKKAYSTISQAWNKYQLDNNCMGKVANCFTSEETVATQDVFTRKFINYFNHIKRVVTYENISNVSWIPDRAYHLNGNLISNYWMGVHKNGGNSSASAFFALSDGTVFRIHMPDNYRDSGTIFIDTNGVKGPNRIGKDQFPIGIGAHHNSKYEDKVHPYYAEDSSGGEGLCLIRNNNECNPDICARENCSPTAYVLKYNKFPPINW